MIVQDATNWQSPASQAEALANYSQAMQAAHAGIMAFWATWEASQTDHTEHWSQVPGHPFE